DVIHLVDNGVVERFLHLLEIRIELLISPAGRLHVVAQVVETELAIGAVGDVTIVGLPAGDRVHVGLDGSGRDAQGLVNWHHSFAVAAGQVIVHSDDVYALAFERVQVRRQRGNEGLTFAGNHLGDVAAMQDDAAEDLHVEMPHVLGAPSGFTAGGERFGQQIV